MFRVSIRREQRETKADTSKTPDVHGSKSVLEVMCARKNYKMFNCALEFIQMFSWSPVTINRARCHLVNFLSTLLITNIWLQDRISAIFFSSHGRDCNWLFCKLRKAIVCVWKSQEDKQITKKDEEEICSRRDCVGKVLWVYRGFQGQ